MHPARMLVVAVFVAACTRRPSAELELDPPDGESEPTGQSSEEPEARFEGVCEHSYAVLASESPSLRSPGIERDFITACISRHRLEHAELGEQQWTVRASCIERAHTSEELGACSGRAPLVEPNPPVSAAAADVRGVCRHVFNVLINENPDIATVFVPEQLELAIEECTKEAEKQRAEDPLTFDRQAACFMAAKTAAEFEACED